MKQYLPILKKSLLFANFTEEEILTFFECFSCKEVSFKKGEVIDVFSRLPNSKNMMLVLSGSVLIAKEDISGRNIVVNDINEGGIFGELAMFYNDALPGFYATASTNTHILVIDVDKAKLPCKRACTVHNKLLANMPRLISMKMLGLIYRTVHLLQGSVRDKILSFLHEDDRLERCFSKNGVLNKSLMAIFLNVDRTTLSKELALLKDEGVITCTRNSIQLLKKDLLALFLILSYCF